MSTLPFPGRPITVALAGNPNSGKTTIFNHLTGSRQRVGNFSGVTVAKKEGLLTHNGRVIRIVDLPGLYSLSSSSMEEIVSRRYILEEQPDLVLNILDAGNLERNLFLTTQLIEMGLPRVYCLNMIDEARSKGVVVDLAAFSTLLGGPVVETVGRTGSGMKELLDTLVGAVDSQRGRHIDVGYDHHLEVAIERVGAELIAGKRELHANQARWLAIKLLEGDLEIAAREGVAPTARELAATLRTGLVATHGMEPELLFAAGRYGFIHGLMQETVRVGNAVGRDLTHRVDDLLLHRWLGLPIFLLLMWVMFQTTFSLGQYPADWIDLGVAGMGEWLAGVMPEGVVRELVVDGMVGGIGSVLVFLPNIILLFLFIAFFEDSGYMARVAFLMDRFMHTVGLHGKAFIPMLMGFGCNVPAIMATRAMESPRDRLLAILINPFMSCSARLPIYMLFCAAFFPLHAGSVVFLLYLAGIGAALGAAFLLKHSLFRGISDPFVMELPPYRLPTLRSVVIHMWERAVQFLKKVGGVILVGSLIIWFLQGFPREVPATVEYSARIARLETLPPTPVIATELTHLAHEQAAREQEQRFLGQLGHYITPLFAPLGFDWKASVALLTGFVAKEVVVSTLGVLHHVGQEATEASVGLRQGLQRTMSLPAAAAFMIFSLLYIPCLSTIGVIRRETGSWRWTAFSVSFSLTTAWALSWVVYRVGSWW